MSTRCNVTIKDYSYNGNVITLYHHHDGYPEGVGQLLKDFVDNYDGYYMTDNYVAKGLLRNNFADYEWGKDYETANFEITSCIHGDIDYLYEIEIFNEGKQVAISCYEYGMRDYEDYENYPFNEKLGLRFRHTRTLVRE